MPVVEMEARAEGISEGFKTFCSGSCASGTEGQGMQPVPVQKLM